MRGLLVTAGVGLIGAGAADLAMPDLLTAADRLGLLALGAAVIWVTVTRMSRQIDRIAERLEQLDQHLAEHHRKEEERRG